MSAEQNMEFETLEKRIVLFLESQEWDKAKEYCEKSLDLNPENAAAYMYALLTELKITSIEGLVESKTDFGNNNNFVNALKFATEKQNEEWTNIYKQSRLNFANGMLEKKPSISAYKKAITVLEQVSDYENADELLSNCKEKLQIKKHRKKTAILSAVSIVLIAFVAVITVFVSNYFIMANKKGRCEEKISTLNSQKAKLDKDFSPVQKVLDEKKKTLSEARLEMVAVGLRIEEIQQTINRYETARQNEVDNYMDNMIDNYYRGYSVYNEREVEGLNRRTNSYDSMIAQMKESLNETRNELNAREAVVNQATGDLEKYQNEKKTEIDKYEKKTADIDKGKKKLNKQINSLKKETKKFPYKFFNKLFKKI